MATGPIPFASDPADLSRRSQKEKGRRFGGSASTEGETTTESDAGTAVDAAAKRKMPNGAFVAAAFADAASSRDEDDDNDDDQGNAEDATTTSMRTEETKIISFNGQSLA